MHLLASGHDRQYRMAKMSHLYRLFSAKEPYDWWLFCGKRPATWGISLHQDSTSDTGWLRCRGCLMLQVIFRKRATNHRALFRKRATNHRALLQKMTYTDKASNGSSPCCSAYVHSTGRILRIIGLFCGKWPIKIRYPMLSCTLERMHYLRVHNNIGCRIFMGHFPQKSPIIRCAFAERDLQLKASCGAHVYTKGRTMEWLRLVGSLKL